MKKILFLVLFLFTFSHAYSQSVNSPFLLNVITKLDTLTSNNPVEKVYLQLDRPYYALGDTLRFKAYLTATDQHKLSAISGILYTDLIGPDSKIIRSIKMEVTGGTAAGDIALSDTLAEGNYRIRAYTNWMRNNSSDLFFDRTISLVKTASAQVLIHAEYKNIAVNNVSQLHGLLTYTDKYGRPYANKMIKYELKFGGPASITGQAKTDTGGCIDITLPANSVQKSISNIVTQIQLYNNGVSVTKSVPVGAPGNNAIQFFPESGQQVVGIRSKVAFKAIGADGLGINAKGTIVDNEGNDVAYFESSHLGMGVFAMTPLGGKTYSAKITYADGSKNTVALPSAVSSGFVLAIDNRDSLKMYVRVIANPNLLVAKQNSSFYLVGQSGGTIYYTTMQKLTDPVFTAEIPKSKFPTGMVQFTLFSETGEPLNERVIFVQKNNQLKLNIQSGKKQFASREKVTMDIQARDNADQPAVGSFSISVIDQSRVPYNQNAQSTILSYILLTSELQGYIQEPGYYFNNVTEKSNADLDILMLSQGYRRFEWKKIMAGQYPITTYFPEHDINLSGFIQTQSGKPVIKGKVSIYSPKLNSFIDTLTDNQGKFKFDGLDFPDTTKLVIQARKANDGKNVNISLDQNPLPKVYPNKNLNEASTEIFLQQMEKGIVPDTLNTQKLPTSINTLKTLSEVNIIEKKAVKPTIFNKYGTKEQYEVKMSRMAGYSSIFDALGRIPGIFFTTKLAFSDFKGHPVSIMLDEIPIPDQTYLRSVPVEDVQSISVVYGNGDGDLIMIYTKKLANTDVVKLQDVNIVSKKKKAPQVVNSTNLNGPGVADQVIMGASLANCGLLRDCLISRIFGVSYSNGNFFALRKQTHISGGPLPMIVIVDGVQLPPDELGNINSNDVSSVEILISGANLNLYGSSAPGGIILVTTKRGAGTDNAYAYKSVPGVIYYKFNGFYKSKTFYAPQYDHPNGIGDGLDKRKTIYWNPNINTDKTGNTSVIFFNADNKGTYQAIVEGVDANGNLGHAVYEYKVQ